MTPPGKRSVVCQSFSAKLTASRQQTKKELVECGLELIQCLLWGDSSHDHHLDEDTHGLKTLELIFNNNKILKILLKIKKMSSMHDMLSKNYSFCFNDMFMFITPVVCFCLSWSHIKSWHTQGGAAAQVLCVVLVIIRNVCPNKPEKHR